MARPDDDGSRVIAGRYRLLSSLGAGGMGRVWLAHDQELACDVALKEVAVQPGITEAELTARIARARGEARHSARLRSNPHVATVYDCIVDGGLPWIVMEYVPGALDLEAVVREFGPLSPAETARVGLDLIDALNHGHQLGILHRDVKPSNVLLTRQESAGTQSTGIGRVLLTDYGISLQQDSGEPRLTTASGIIGTPGYLAPERAHGSAPTPASDLFSLGATLYFAVDGHSPFDRTSYVATLSALLAEDPAPPRRAGGLAPILLRLLAKDPAQRLGADEAKHLFHQFTTPSLPGTYEPTITAGPRPSSEAPTPQPSVAPSAPNSESHSTQVPQTTRHAGLPWIRPTAASGTARRQPSRKTRRIIAVTATALVIGIGVGTWALATSPSEPDETSPSASPSTPPSASPPSLDSWAKKVCDAQQPQAKKIEGANTAIQQTPDNSTPEDVQRTDSQAFQDMSDAYKAIGDTLKTAGPPPVSDGQKKQRDAIKQLEYTSTSYANLKKQVDGLDTTDQSKFADGLKKIAQELDELGQNPNEALVRLEEGDVGEAMQKQEGCRST
ncbi:serine/threonine-protein kinase [Streptomyces sp. SID12488]|uniref:protein kinase domain-containing protein n=1 Tax=Streptomyces sp. SID12488 TaxID=2706040 RepID=UPI0013DA59AF|nr:serine/threonine protein kinase [Streptomyces sp. SID12488]